MARSCYQDQFWQKLKAFEDILSNELVAGPRRESVLTFAQGLDQAGHNQLGTLGGLTPVNWPVFWMCAAPIALYGVRRFVGAHLFDDVLFCALVGFIALGGACWLNKIAVEVVNDRGSFRAALLLRPAKGLSLLNWYDVRTNFSVAFFSRFLFPNHGLNSPAQQFVVGEKNLKPISPKELASAYEACSLISLYKILISSDAKCEGKRQTDDIVPFIKKAMSGAGDSTRKCIVVADMEGFTSFRDYVFVCFNNLVDRKPNWLPHLAR